MTPNERLVLLAGLAAVLVVVGVVILLRLRVTPEERERRRRSRLFQYGRMRDGIVTDVAGDSVYYSYSVAGVAYATSQDVSSVRYKLPESSDALIGPVTLRYLPRNPANSIVVCEEWSGLRAGRDVAAHN